MIPGLALLTLGLSKDWDIPGLLSRFKQGRRKEKKYPEWNGITDGNAPTTASVPTAAPMRAAAPVHAAAPPPPPPPPPPPRPAAAPQTTITKHSTLSLVNDSRGN